ncbi:5'-methylthioadenosine/adenosylhomocysteine nucleosidase [Lutibacter sp. HS1-25]|uniref:5'-methylthioadenosine/adenosylhomocysteine nucleosidase n=1 Tax=Lutibacter sp. HS1-25 TaxID=2485000 RepID=UPI0010118247|nr:5'-methylthioadenosine/adenosylhomocysteine nucleosidase [Lutibacter sp. HS1-25]RXP52319.1 5'-methylthioadenosine/adenosylhomocysteine nucleosidase [Lutibacter sp. HS1-25]
MIGIISAMQEEIQALLHQLENTTITEKGMRKYYQGTLFGKEVILVFSRWGKVASAVTTTQLINDFDVSEIIFTGVAGGIVNELNIGDVVIGKNLFQHDLNASPFYEKLEIPILKKKFLNTSDASKLLAATNTFFKNYNTYIKPSDAALFDIDNPKVVFGDIASGDQFISSLKKIKKLNKLIPTATCVEMEGAAVAQVCFEYQIPFSIIRIISDKANDNAHIDFSTFANSIASNYALGILKNYFS